MSVIYSHRHQRYIDTDFDSEYDFDTDDFDTEEEEDKMKEILFKDEKEKEEYYINKFKNKTMKRNNKSSYFKDWTDKKLKDMFTDFELSKMSDPDNLDYKDYMTLEGLSNELKNREISYYTKTKIIFN